MLDKLLIRYKKNMFWFIQHPLLFAVTLVCSMCDRVWRQRREMIMSVEWTPPISVVWTHHVSAFLLFEVRSIWHIGGQYHNVKSMEQTKTCIMYIYIYICRHSSIWQTCFLRTVLHIFNLIHSPTISTKDAPDATSPQVSSMALSRGWISCWAAHASMAFGSDTTTKRWLVRRIRGLFHWNCSTRGERYVEVWYVLIWYHVIWFLMIWYNMMWYDMMSFVHFIQQYCSCYVTVHIYTL